MLDKFIEHWKLGVLYKDGKVVSHRSALKVFLNPVIGKLLGKIVATKFNGVNPGKLALIKQKREFIGWNPNNHKEFDRIERIRIWL